MKHYLTLIRKSDFTDLFRFGYIYLDSKVVTEFNGDVGSLPNNNSIRDKVLSRPNPFDYSFTMLLIHFAIDNFENGYIGIENVMTIFALDLDAKREIEISYDPRIRIDNPIWPNAFTVLQERFFIDDAKKGSKNIWRILNIDQPISEFSRLLLENDFEVLAHQVVNDERPHGPQSFWLYLMRYERHGFFPHTSLGYVMDLINIFINVKSEEEQPYETVERTEIYKVLNSISNPKNLNSIIEELSEINAGRNFFDRVNEIAGKNNANIIALLFLVLRNRFINGFNLTEESRKILAYSKKNFPEEFPYALYLLGIFLGNKHTFECLYDELPLAIFKEQIEKDEPAEDDDLKPKEEDGKIRLLQEGEIKVYESLEDTVEKPKVVAEPSHNSLFKDEEFDLDEGGYPDKARKKGRGGKALSVHSREHWLQLKLQGYVPDKNAEYKK